MQKIELIGRLVNDVELSKTKNDTTYGKFVVAVDRPTKEKKTDFFKCTCWGSMADNLSIYTTKGTLVFVAGYLEIDKYTDHVGQIQTAIQVICNQIEYLGNPKQVQEDREEVNQ